MPTRDKQAVGKLDKKLPPAIMDNFNLTSITINYQRSVSEVFFITKVW